MRTASLTCVADSAQMRDAMSPNVTAWLRSSPVAGHMQVQTGASLVDSLKSRRVKLAACWHAAEQSAQDRRLWAEEILERVEENDVRLEESDSRLLERFATDESPQVAVTAIRLIGMLIEDGYLPKSNVGVLVDLLLHHSPERRYYAVKAIWQARGESAIPALRCRLEEERSPQVLALVERAIAVLER